MANSVIKRNQQQKKVIQFDDVIDITVKTSVEEIKETKIKFSKYLKSLIGIDIVSLDENGSSEKFLELKENINGMYKTLHCGENLDSHWREERRFFQRKKYKIFS